MLPQLITVGLKCFHHDLFIGLERVVVQINEIPGTYRWLLRFPHQANLFEEFSLAVAQIDSFLELRFGDLVVQIGRGDTIIIAAIMTGKTPEPLHDEIRAAIAEIEKNHKESFLNWDGEIQGLDFLHEYMKKLVLREYKKPHFAS